MKTHFASALRSDFDVFRTADTAAAEIRAKQLRALVRMTPFALAANVLNGALAWFTLRPFFHGYALTTWVAALAVVSLFSGKRWWQHRHVPKDTASPRTMRRAVLHATMLALIWAALAVLWFPSASASQRLILTMLITGMLGGGAIILAPIPMASVAYVCVLAAGASIALLLSREPPLYYALALVTTYSISMILSAITTARASIARHISERESAQQHLVIGLWLRDFEEHSADVLGDRLRWRIHPCIRQAGATAGLRPGAAAAYELVGVDRAEPWHDAGDTARERVAERAAVWPTIS